MASSDNEKSAVDDSAKYVLALLDYDAGKRLLRIRKEVSFYMGGQKADARSSAKRSVPGEPNRAKQSGETCVSVSRSWLRLLEEAFCDDSTFDMHISTPEELFS
ncbi:hypothetical protein ONZ45_g13570 [Pleurotus djamor]|nr:hypothetical protein ONZ45_g13570 [Pleurotus djamor]